MYAGAVFVQQIFKWDLYLSILLILGITAIFTVLGMSKYIEHSYLISIFGKNFLYFKQPGCSFERPQFKT